MRRKKKVNFFKINPISNCEEKAINSQRIKISSAYVGNPPVNVSEWSIIPTVNRYFYAPTADIDLTNGVSIPANEFFNDDNQQVNEFIIFSPNGYVNLYINGMIQEGGFYKANVNSLTLNPNNATIFAGVPIIVESLGFSVKLN